jgi:hypothetical protein
MASEIRLSNAAVNAEADAFGALHNSGYLRIYAGTKPAGPDTAITSQTLLAELRFASTAFGAASAGVLTAGAITRDEDANATGTASFFRTLKSDGTTALLDGTCGTSAADLIMDRTDVTSGQPVECSALVYTRPKS